MLINSLILKINTRACSEVVIYLKIHGLDLGVLVNYNKNINVLERKSNNNTVVFVIKEGKRIRESGPLANQK